MYRVVIYFLLVFSLSSCFNSKPDLSKISVDSTIRRFDKDLFAADTINIKESIDSLANKYGRYWLMYNQGVLGTGDPSAPDFDKYFKNFITDKTIGEVYDTCAYVFNDMSILEKELEKALKYFKYYLPAIEIPKFYSHISGFNQSIVADSAILSVSIDNYLGEKCKFYDLLASPIPLYARKDMCKERIPYDLLKAMALINFEFITEKNNLLSNILYKGKILYILSQVFPEKTEDYIMGYTDDQYSWCKNNESASWAFFIEKDYLYSTDQFIISKYINAAPYSSGMPSESPGRVACWVGLQIIKSYMKTGDYTLESLMTNSDYDLILRKSNYQPE